MRRSLTPIVTAVLLATLAGCAGKIADPNSAAIDANGSIAPLLPSIVPDSPHALVDAFVEAMGRRDPVHYGRLFTDDFEFAFANWDSAGSSFFGRKLNRRLELEYAEHLFVSGTSVLSPATSIDLVFDRSWIVLPDSRPGRSFPWHQEVWKNYRLWVDAGDYGFSMTGSLRFFVVRGDSAAIPPDLASRGFHPDSSRWWIERWEDEFDPSGPAPAGAHTEGLYTTWGSLKWFYLGTP